MMNRLILVAARDQARIFYHRPSDFHFELLQKVEFPMGRLRRLVTQHDQPGSGRSGFAGAVAKHGMDSENHARKDLIHRFAKKLIESISKEWDASKKLQQEDRYNELLLVAEPHLLGELRIIAQKKLVQKRLKDVLINDMPKDYAHLTEPELRRRLKIARPPLKRRGLK